MGCALCRRQSLLLPPKDALAFRGEKPATAAQQGSAATTATTTSSSAQQPPPPVSPSATAAPGPHDLFNSRIRKQDVREVYDISGESEILGTGISGAVRVCRHKVNGKLYALKTLSLENVNTKKAALLRNEVAIYLKLDHPNIAKLIEVYESPDAIRLVMELCTGGELYDRLAERKKYSEADAAHVTQQMLAAINYCHQHRICHRDLKLENWVYSDRSPDAALKLIDFGFSRIFNPGVPMTAMHGTVYYVSPEVMEGCYGEKCDIWSLGVIVFMLLSGAPPFNGSHDHQILLKIKRGQYSFSGPRWVGISDMAKDFIRCLLQREASDRPSAEEALKHPWLQQNSANAIARPIAYDVVVSMRNFALGNSLRRAALGIVALGMTTREVEELEQTFRALDKNSRGTIQLQDLAQVLVSRLSINEKEAQRIFEKLDATGSREVHYSEFLASALQSKIIKNEALVREAFNRFDVENKGCISADNLRSVLGDTYNGCTMEEIVRVVDSDGDGVISFDEFSRALLSDATAFQQRPSGVSPGGATTTMTGGDLSNNNHSSSLEEPQQEEEAERQAALLVLQSMRKATCLTAVAEAEKTWYSERHVKALLRRASEAPSAFLQVQHHFG